MKRTILTMFFLMCLALPTAAQDNMSQQFEGFNLVGYKDDGSKEWDINGEAADMLGEEVDIKNVDANMYGESEDVNVKAKRGIYNKTTGDVKLRKDVVITNSQGATLKTDELDWSKEKDLVETEDFVFITDEKMNLRGKGMKAKPSIKDAELHEDVKANIETESALTDSNLISITCDGPMEIDQMKNMATFYNNVEAYEVATGRRMNADRMDVYFHPETRKIQEVICTGNVSVSQGKNVTYSESLVYKAQEQRMVLSGRPKLLINTESDSGEFNDLE